MKKKKFVMTKETNLEHYLEQIKKIEDYDSFCIRKDDQALCACGEVDCNRCTFGDAGNCAIARIDWMASPYTGDRCRLTKVEWDILDAYVQESYPGTFKQFSNLMCMKEKGYFKSVDSGKELKEILANCVVIEHKDQKQDRFQKRASGNSGQQ